MPVTPARLKQRRKAVTFDYGGDPVTVEYYPAAAGADMLPTLNKLQADANAALADGDEAAADKALLDVGAWLCTLLASWDYLEDDGETMQPITPENLARQMVAFTDFMQAVVVAIVGDRTRGNANGTSSSAPSAATSSPTGSSASTGASLNPSTSSSSPVGSGAAARRSTGS